MDSKLAVREVDLPYKNSPRNKKISVITPHHTAGVMTAEQYESVAKNRKESCQYFIDNNGTITQFCPEGDRSWCSSSPENDNKAVTIEVSNSKNGGNWPISDKAYNALIELCVDICKRNGIDKLVWTGDKNGSLTTHDMFAVTACPGPYLKAKMPEIAETVTKRLAANKTEVKMEVKDTNPASTPKKTISELADEVIQGKWGNNPDRKKRLTDAGYDYAAEQKEVDSRLAKSTPKKSIDEIAKEVIRGDWGNGAVRKNKLNAAGYKYDGVQAKVDELLNGSNTTAQPQTATKLAAAHKFDAKRYAGSYRVLSDVAAVRLVPGNTSNASLLTTVRTKTTVQCYGYYEQVGSDIWLLVVACGKTGFMNMSTLRKI